MAEATMEQREQIWSTALMIKVSPPPPGDRAKTLLEWAQKAASEAGIDNRIKLLRNAVIADRECDVATCIARADEALAFIHGPNK